MIVVNEVTSNYEILLQLIYYFSSFRFVNGFKSLKSDNLFKFIFICSYLLFAVRRLKLTKGDKVFFISCMRYEILIGSKQGKIRIGVLTMGYYQPTKRGGVYLESAILSLMSPK